MQRITLDSEIVYIVTEKELKEIRRKTINEIIKEFSRNEDTFLSVKQFCTLIELKMKEGAENE